MRPMSPRVLVRSLRADAVVPKYLTARAAGLDLCAAIDAPIALAPGARAAVGTGLAIALPDGYEGQVRPRSGLAREHGVTGANGVTVANAPGTIDADYRGELIVLLINLGTAAVTITGGMRIAQLVIAPVVQAELAVVDALPTTDRGAGGFGSTGR
jgi:dUTP pyrophosphatase